MNPKIIVTRADDSGRFAEVGMADRWLFDDISSEVGAIRRARQYSHGRAYRIEWFHADDFYKPDTKPFRVLIQEAFDFQVESKPVSVRKARRA